MKMVIQRVSRAEVRVDGRVVGRIGVGLAVLVGLQRGDGEDQLRQAARRLSTLRVFSDDDGRMNRGLDEVGGAVKDDDVIAGGATDELEGGIVIRGAVKKGS